MPFQKSTSSIQLEEGVAYYTPKEQIGKEKEFWREQFRNPYRGCIAGQGPRNTCPF
jgi:hypothetical protein